MTHSSILQGDKISFFEFCVTTRDIMRKNWPALWTWLKLSYNRGLTNILKDYPDDPDENDTDISDDGLLIRSDKRIADSNRIR
jgi:hypothetical protein